VDGIHTNYVQTPGHGGFAIQAGLESPLPLLHAYEVDSGLRPFSTLSMDPHVRGTPPGFSVPLTPRERMIRAAQMESLLPGHAEPVHTLQGWEWPQGTDMVDRSSDRVSSSDNIIIIIYSDAEPHDRSSLPFASKISLVREILGDKVPVSVVSREHSSRVVSLLSRGNDREGPSASHLPLAAVVRSAMFVASKQVAAATAAAPLDRKGSVDGLPLAAAAFKRARRHYQVSSPDFALTQSTVSREVSAAGSVPNVTLPPRVMKSLG